MIESTDLPGAVGIIAEFDPFHMGHRYLIETVRQKFPEKPIVCVMSGAFTQRGGPACLSPFSRAEAAVKCGVNLCMSIPLATSLSCAEWFAFGSVGILEASNIVDTLVFGTECGDLEYLKQIADMDADSVFQKDILYRMKDGTGYAKAFGLSASQDQTANPLNSNDILAVEYLRSLNQLSSSIQPFQITREGSHGVYNGKGFLSSSVIRSELKNGFKIPYSQLPQETSDILERDYQSGSFLLDEKRVNDSLLLFLNSIHDFSCFEEVPDGGEGLINRIRKYSKLVSSFDELCDRCSCKRYTKARVRRCVWQLYFRITKSMQQTIPSYTQIYAADPVGCQLIKRMKQNSTINVITKPSDHGLLSGHEIFSYELDLLAESIRSIGCRNRTIPQQKTPFIFEKTMK